MNESPPPSLDDTHEHPIWVFPSKNDALKQSIVTAFNVHPVVAQILISRGFTSLDTIRSYLYGTLPDLYDPALLTDMSQAVRRIACAMRDQEPILIYGDNDVDGMSGTALLTELLQDLGHPVFFFISNRHLLRQSLIIEALEFAQAHDCRLLITVDCGITAATEIAQVVHHGIDVIVTDHHEPTDTIPHCVATLNPKLLNNPYPNKDLTGVGVAFKLAHALVNYLSSEGMINEKQIDLKKYLDLVLLGTISDMGSLLEMENRILVRYGLRQLKKGRRLGLLKLLEITGISPSDVTPFIVGSQLTPRLNSLGRINDPQKGVEILLANDPKRATALAHDLTLNNLERQKIERAMTADMYAMLAADPTLLSDRAIMMGSDRWHHGVIAILSTKMSRRYHRPTAIATIEGEVVKVSMRSIKELPLMPILKESADLLLNFGGHNFAAGLTIKKENFEEFRGRFIRAANRALKDIDIKNKIYIDSLVAFKDLSYDFIESLRLLEPYGNENPQPILYCTASQAYPPKLVGKNHLKLYLSQQDERILEAIFLGRADLIPQVRKKHLALEVAFTPQVIKSTIQLFVRDCRILDHSPHNCSDEQSTNKSL